MRNSLVVVAAVLLAVVAAVPKSKFAVKHQQQLSAFHAARQSDPTALTVGGVAVTGAVAHGATVNVDIPKIANGANANVPFVLTATQMANTLVEYDLGLGAGFQQCHPANQPMAAFNVPLAYGPNNVVLRLTHQQVQRTLTVVVTREPTEAEKCAAVVANLNAGNAGQIVAAALATLGDGRQASTTHICQIQPIVAFRTARNYGAACDVVGLEIDHRGALRGTAASAARPTFQFALEEEMVQVWLEQSTLPNGGHSIASTTLCKSGNAAVPPVAYLKLDVDHITGDDGQPWNVLEVVTHPMDVTLVSLATHRSVVTHVSNSIPTGFWSWKSPMGPFGTAGTVAHTLNAALPNGLANYRITTNSYGSIANVKAKRYVNGVRNNIQVNYDLSICALFNGNANGGAFDTMWSDAFGLALLVKMRVAATAYLANEGAAVLTNARIQALPNQQQCELSGLFTMFMFQMVGKEIITEHHIAVNSGQQPKAWHLNAGSTTKNFWEQMVKTNVWSVVQELSYPLAGLLHEWYQTEVAASAQAKTATANAFVARVRAAMVASNNNWVATYGGNAPVYLTGAFWETYLNNFDVQQAGNGAQGYTPTSMNGRHAPHGDAPPAFRVRAGAHAMRDQVSVVMESRFPRSPINRALSDKPPNGGGDLTQQQSLNRIVNGQTSYQGGAELADWIATC